MQVFLNTAEWFLTLKAIPIDWWQNLTLKNNGYLSVLFELMMNTIRLTQTQFKITRHGNKTNKNRN